MSLPLIGVSASKDEEARQLVVRENYMTSLLRAGGVPVMLSRTQDEAAIASLLDRLDGILFSGGVDVEPSRYGEETLPSCGEIDLQRDAFELLLIRMALSRGIPVFGICRGIQLIAVAMGGTLYQDVEAQLAIPRIVHQQQPPYDAPTHAVRLSGELARLLGTDMIHTNSMHHQAVKDAGPRLIVEGRAEDGVIEAVRAADGSDVYAVQYHPEYMSHCDEHAARLFAFWVERANAYARRKARVNA